MAELLQASVDEWVGELLRLTPENDDVNVLRLTDGTTAATVRGIGGAAWLLAESSNFQPAPELRVPRGLTNDDDCPFRTEGDQWLINLYDKTVTERYFMSEEGEIQGFVYALDAYTHGGALTPADYVDFLRRQIEEAAAGESFSNLKVGHVNQIEMAVGGLIK